MSLTNKEKKEKTRIILAGMAEISDRSLNKDGSLNVEAFNELPEVKKAVKKLKSYRISKKWLNRNGFILACMLLEF